MFGEALVVWLPCDVRVVKQSNRTNLITNDDDGFPKNLPDLDDLIVSTKLVMDSFNFLIGAKPFSKPFKFKVDGVSLDGSLGLNLIKSDLTNVIFNL